MRKAVIDLGTNTFNLLIADVKDGRFQRILSTKIGVALGMGGILQNRISEDAFERGIQALREFKRICEDYDVSQITAIGTSALRDASNANNFRQKIKEQFAIEIQIIDGEKEAQLIYEGVKLTYNFQQQAMIMDIGGGSTEFIFADRNGIQFLISLNIGVSRMYQEIQTSDPLHSAEIAHIENWLESKANGFFDAKNADIIIGASGTFETFYELIHDTDFISGFETITLSRDELNDCLEQIIKSTQEEREQNHRIIPIRKKMAPVAAVKTMWVMNKLDVKEIVISPFSLKEGALMYYSI
jgi:exopolyphosphatase/guanosine-5'-triphosphate,3'-diphosphate pyrophosphatase